MDDTMQRKRASVLPLFVFQLGNLYSLQKTRREVFHALKSCQAAAWRHDTERGQARFSDRETKRGHGETKMTEKEANEVWELAHNAAGPIKFSEAAVPLKCNGTPGVAEHIAAASRWLEAHNRKCDAIEVIRTFVDQNYKWPWQKK